MTIYILDPWKNISLKQRNTIQSDPLRNNSSWFLLGLWHYLQRLCENQLIFLGLNLLITEEMSTLDSITSKVSSNSNVLWFYDFNKCLVNSACLYSKIGKLPNWEMCSDLLLPWGKWTSSINMDLHQSMTWSFQSLQPL